MKENISNVKGMIEALGIKENAKYDWPTNLQEVRDLCKTEKIVEKSSGKEIPLSMEKFLSHAWRGFTLSFQKGGEGVGLTEEQKIANKEARKAETAAIKATKAKAKASGTSLQDLLALAMKQLEEKTQA